MSFEAERNVRPEIRKLVSETGKGENAVTRSDALQSFDLREPQRLRRGPAVPVALCFALGIALDRWQEIPWEAWLLTLWVLAICWLVLHCRKKDGRATVVLLACCACVGGARHH